MIKKKATGKNETSLKETIIKEITPLLTAALATLKDRLGEKKLEKRIKKAAKLLVSGIKPAITKKPLVKKKHEKKVAKKTLVPASSPKPKKLAKAGSKK